MYDMLKSADRPRLPSGSETSRMDTTAYTQQAAHGLWHSAGVYISIKTSGGSVQRNAPGSCPAAMTGKKFGMDFPEGECRGHGSQTQTQDKRLFHCRSQEAGWVKYDKYTCKNGQ